MRDSKTRSPSLRLLLRLPVLPDPRGAVGFAIALGVLFSHLTLPAPPTTSLWSEDPLLEVLGHVWLLLGPPLSVYLGLRHVLLRGDSLLPLVSVPLGVFLTLLTALGVGLGLMS